MSRVLGVRLLLTLVALGSVAAGKLGILAAPGPHPGRRVRHRAGDVRHGRQPGRRKPPLALAHGGARRHRVRAALANLAHHLGMALSVLRHREHARLVADVAAGRIDPDAARRRAITLLEGELPRVSLGASP
jgi:hypothetical protein